MKRHSVGISTLRFGQAFGLACLVLSACSENSGGGNQNHNNNNLGPCPDGTLLNVTACIPVFDDCTGPAEIPVLGGGCMPVGVPGCALGTGCASGFADDGQGGCEPTLPAAACPVGSLALLGNSACQRIRECGTTTWGNLPTTTGWIFVDGSHNDGSYDGTEAHPYRTIGAALAAATPHAYIAVAAGSYPESLNVTQPVILAGRCPEQVTVTGSATGVPASPALTIAPAGSGAEIAGIRLSGGGHGLVVNEATQILLTEVEIADTDGYGLLLQRGAAVHMTRTKITGTTTGAVVMFGGRVQISLSDIRETNSAPDGSFGRGIDAGCDHLGSGGCPIVEVNASILTANREAGVFIQGGEATITGSLVQFTQPNTAHGKSGIGILAQCDTTSADCPTLVVTGSVVRGNRTIGIEANGENTVIQDTVVSGTLPQQDDSKLGNGVVAQCDGSLGVCGTFRMTCSTVDGNHATGIFVSGIAAHLESSIVRNTGAQESDLGSGYGVLAQCEYFTRACADLELQTSLIRGNTWAGLFLQGSTATLDNIWIDDTQPGDADPKSGLAIHAQCDQSVGECVELHVDASLFESSRAVGLSLFGVNGDMDRSTVQGVAAQPPTEENGIGIYIEGDTEDASSAFDISHCDVEEAVMTGAYYVSASGVVSRSRFAGGDYPVILQNASVALETGNELYGAVQNDPLIQ